MSLLTVSKRKVTFEQREEFIILSQVHASLTENVSDKAHFNRILITEKPPGMPRITQEISSKNNTTLYCKLDSSIITLKSFYNMNHVLWLSCSERQQRAAQLQLIIQSIFKTSYSHKAEGSKLISLRFSQLRMQAGLCSMSCFIEKRQITDTFLWHLIQKSLFFIDLV